MALRFITLSLLLTVAACASVSRPQTVTKSIAWTVSERLCEPETVLRIPGSDSLIVSNICGFKKNGEGYLSKIDIAGNVLEPRWIDGMNAPAGMAIRGDLLFVVDIDRVHEVDLAAGKISRSFLTEPAARALNDIAITSDGDIFVSDSATGQVLRYSDAAFSRFPSVNADFKFANGMHYQDGAIIIGGEKLWKVDLKSLAISTINVEGLSDIDGIESDGQSGLIVSVVGGDVWHLPKDGIAEIWTADSLSSTNHAYLPSERLVVVPTGYDNTIIAFEAP